MKNQVSLSFITLQIFQHTLPKPSFIQTDSRRNRAACNYFKECIENANAHSSVSLSILMAWNLKIQNSMFLTRMFSQAPNPHHSTPV